MGDEQLWQLKREFQIAFLKNRGLQPDHHFLDVGCGTLRGGIPVIDYLDAGHYVGVEVRQQVIDEAWAELAEAGLQAKEPQLIASGMKDLQLEHPVDVAWAFSVLIHMEDEVLEDCLLSVARCLETSGVFYANVNIGDNDLGTWQGFPVQSRSMEFYRSIASGAGLSVQDVGSLGELGHRSGRPAQDAQRMLLFARS